MSNLSEVVGLRVAPHTPILINGDRLMPGKIATVRGRRRLSEFGEPSARQYAALSGEAPDGKKDYWLSNRHNWRKADNEREFQAHVEKSGKDWEAKFERKLEHQRRAEREDAERRAKNAAEHAAANA